MRTDTFALLLMTGAAEVLRRRDGFEIESFLHRVETVRPEIVKQAAGLAEVFDRVELIIVKGLAGLATRDAGEGYFSEGEIAKVLEASSRMPATVQAREMIAKTSLGSLSPRGAVDERALKDGLRPAGFTEVER